MNPFEHLMKDEITLFTQGGEIFRGIKAMVQAGSILPEGTSVPFKEGDRILRILPSGAEENYTIVESHFNNGIGGIPSFYKLIVEKII